VRLVFHHETNALFEEEVVTARTNYLKKNGVGRRAVGNLQLVVVC
jgi:hypothetical protein